MYRCPGEFRVKPCLRYRSGDSLLLFPAGSCWLGNFPIWLSLPDESVGRHRRKVVNNDLLQKLEEILDDYFNNEKSVLQGIPTVQFLSEALNVSPSYLSDMLRSLTGQNAQQHIHDKLIQKAKEKLSTTELSVSEIAYALGFEHAQSFSRLFKSKTKLSPLTFRQSFN